MEFICRSVHEQDYKILFDWKIIDRASQILQEHGLGAPYFVITDSNVFKHHGKHLQKALRPNQIHTLIVRPGETSKSLMNWKRIQDFLLSKGADRKSTVIAFGGGVVGDLAGFSASTFMRGLNFVQIPTTILSQSDSSIGAKVAINHPLAKNLLGSFYQPKIILTDPSLLQTLPKREFSAGLGEAIKYGVIADPELFQSLFDKIDKLITGDRELLNNLIQRCIAIKIKVVEEDERETGVRKILNFGHTIGHALEQATGYKQLRHGEAVGWGMLGAGWIAIQRKMWSVQELGRLQSILLRSGCLYDPGNVTTKQIMNALKHDKKKSGKTLQFVLPEETGRVTIVKDLPRELVEEGIRMMFKLGTAKVLLMPEEDSAKRPQAREDRFAPEIRATKRN
ncbi:MAG TPA: 3-dehydroquinate synthase [Acidobacteriota bacterium]|nr:3-dehydroquinate synthase [Acidobacteriota bacterium]